MYNSTKKIVADEGQPAGFRGRSQVSVSDPEPEVPEGLLELRSSIYIGMYL